MRRALWLSWLLVGCAVEPAGEEVGVLRQPFPGLMSRPEAVGRTSGARLGASVAGCKDALIAGAPGESATLYRPGDGGEAWLTYSGLLDAGSLGAAVGCVVNPAVNVVAAGLGGTLAFRPDQTSTVSGSVAGPHRAMAVNPVSGVLLLGDANRDLVELKLLGSTTPTLLDVVAGDGGSSGVAVAWSAAGDRFAVRDGLQGKVRLYTWSGTKAALRHELVVGQTGIALALGDVHPSSGEELIVSASTVDKVRVFADDDAGLREVLVLSPPLSGMPGGFGTALAVEPMNQLAGLHRLWVGDPKNDRAYRFLGDAGEVLAPAMPRQEEFGAALAFNDEALVIGAPKYLETELEQGAVYRFVVDPQVPGSNVTATTCTLGAPCAPCGTGLCTGGVICTTFGPTPQCDAGVGDGGASDAGGRVDAGPGDAGDPDAGPGDAGARDAGEEDAGPADAGRPDAGAPDAGAPDAGPGKADAGPAADAGLVDGGSEAPLRFVAGCQGCTSALGGPWLLLAVALLRRRGPTSPRGR